MKLWLENLLMSLLIVLALFAVWHETQAQQYRIVIPVATLAEAYKGQLAPVPNQAMTWTEITGYSTSIGKDGLPVKIPTYGRQLIDYIAPGPVPPGALWAAKMEGSLCTEVVAAPDGFIFAHEFAGWGKDVCPSQAARDAQVRTP